MGKWHLTLIAATVLATTAFFNGCAPEEEDVDLTIDCSAGGDADCDYAEYCLETEVLDEYGMPTGKVNYECTLRDTCTYQMQDCPMGWYCETTGYCFKGEAPDIDTVQPDNALPDTSLPDNNQPDTTFPDTDSALPDTVQPDADSTQPDTVQPDADTDQPDTAVPDTDTAATLDFTETFESGSGAWTLEGDWQIGAPAYGIFSAHGGSNCAGTNLVGPYSDSADAKLTLNQQLSIPGGAAEPVIEFYAYVNAEGSSMIANDYVEVLIRKSVDTWESATKAVFTQGPYLDSSKTKLTGNTNNADATWQLYRASLSAVKGESVQIAFRFRSDSSSPAAGIYIDDLNIINWDFSEEYISAVEAKQVAEQTLIKTRTEQEQALVVANTEAEKRVIAAEAEAKEIRTLAEVQAESNRVLAESLSDLLIRYETLQKWNGELPKVTGNSTPIIDIGIGE